MVQQGQLIELTRRGRGGEPLWAYRFRGGGRGSKRVQRGGFASEQDAREALERELERLRRERRIARRLTLAELVETYLAQHDVQPVTIEKLRYLLSKATAVFGDRAIGELAEYGMSLYGGSKAALRQFVRGWISEVRERKVRINVLSPGAIDTPSLRTALAGASGEENVEREVKRMGEGNPLGRLG